MKKIALTAVLFLYGLSCFAQAPLVHKVRMMYRKAPVQEKVCEKLIALLAPYNETNNPLLFGYKASAVMMMASHIFNPFRKLSYFIRGKNMLAKAINTDKDNVELRFLRLAAQSKAPSFLGYKDYINEDRGFIIKWLSQAENTHLKKFILSCVNGLKLPEFAPSKTAKSK